VKKEAGTSEKLPIFRKDFKPSLRLLASGATSGCCRTGYDEAAISAMPCDILPIEKRTCL